MITIEYCREGDAISDFACNDWLENILNQEGDMHLQISTSPPCNALRLAIVQGRIPCEDVMFEFEGKELPPNKYGAIMHWPDGFTDLDCTYSEQILRGAIDMRQAERAERETRQSG